MTWSKGQSGNSSGRAKGSKNKATLIREDIARLALEALEHKNSKTKTGNYFDTLKSKDFNDLVKAIVPRESKTDVTSGGEVLKALLAKGSKGK